MIYTFISLILFFLYLALMILYRIGWSGQKKSGSPLAFSPSTTITVVIPARNEQQRIGTCLQSILDNDYPRHLLEIIVADDFSEDDTALVAEGLLQPAQAGFVLKLSQHLTADERLNSYKKKALELAIGQARGSLIVTTDADCILPKKWLHHYAHAFETMQAKFMAAPVNFIPAGKASLLYYFQSLDFMTMQGITAASATLNLGNMCNGANLGFSKNAFDAVNGYKGIDHIASGDDMMLMYKINRAFPQGLRYMKRQEMIVNTPAQPSWSSFLNQRIRWSSKADAYDDKKLTWILALVYFFNLNFLALFIAGFFSVTWWTMAWSLLLYKTVAELFFLYPVSKFYGKQKELLLFPLLQPLHIAYVISAGFLGKFGTYNWKGRKVK